MSYYPAGYSDDEYEDDDGFEYSFSVDRNIESYKMPQVETGPDPRLEIEDKILQAILEADLISLQQALNNNLGISVNASLRSSWTPLLYACNYAKLHVVKYLINQGADVNLHIGFHTPMMAACSHNTNDELQADIVALLLDKNAQVNRCNTYGNTPLMMACDNGLLEVVQILLHKSNVDAEDNKGWSAIFYAINGNHYKICSLLIEKNCSLEQTDMRGMTPIILAETKGFTDIVDLLETCGLSKLKQSDWDDVKYLIENRSWKDLIPGKKFCGTIEPCYYDDVAQMLYGMELENLAPLFLREKVTLQRFLCLTDEQLENIGVFLPFQRKRILESLDKFHIKNWTINSITESKDFDYFDTFDFIMQLAAHYKHIVVMESTLIYLNQRLADHSMLNQQSSMESQAITKWFTSTSKSSYDLQLHSDLLINSIRDFHKDLLKVLKRLEKISMNLKTPVDAITPYSYKTILKEKMNWTNALVSYVLIPTAVILLVKKVL